MLKEPGLGEDERRGERERAIEAKRRREDELDKVGYGYQGGLVRSSRIEIMSE